MKFQTSHIYGLENSVADILKIKKLQTDKFSAAHKDCIALYQDLFTF